MNPTTTCLLILVTVSLLIGCGPRQHSLDEDEWDQIFGMPADNTKAASELVQKDAESRQQWLSLHEDLQLERTEIGRQRDQLETDRRSWDQRERTDSVIAAAITAFSLMIVCSLPLVLVGFLLWPKQADPVDARICDILVEDLTSERQLLDREHRLLDDHR